MVVATHRRFVAVGTSFGLVRYLVITPTQRTSFEPGLLFDRPEPTPKPEPKPKPKPNSNPNP